MTEPHRLLRRQLRRHLTELSPEDPRISEFLAAVNDVYHQEDRDRILLERSLELTSNELIARNQAMTQQLAQLSGTKSALESSHELLQATLNSTYDGLMVLDLKGKIRLHNPAMRNLFGAIVDLNTFDGFWRHCYSRLTLPGKTRKRKKPKSKNAQGSKKAAELLSAMAKSPEEPQFLELVLDGAVTLEVHSLPQFSEKPPKTVIGQVLCFRNVTELKLREAEARHRAYHDQLTGLPNRSLFSEQIEEAMRKGERRNLKTILLFIDLDGFKDVNDTLGHSIGDILLKEAADRLEASLHPEDTLSRHGGDEFIAMLELQKDSARATQAAEAILEALQTPFVLGKEHVVMSASVGIAIAPNDGAEPDTLINKADLAMYHAKEQGKNNYQFFAKELERLSCHRLSIRSQLKHALDNEMFTLYFQPKISLASGIIEGAEALIRWPLGDGKFHSPMEFIPVAEETGQIIGISQWVIRRCAEYLQAWQKDLPSYFSLAINISAKHFRRGVREDIEQVLVSHQIKPSQLEIELTETAVMDDVEQAIEILQALREVGIKTAIDDFGTGYSSLGYLRRLPIDILKIDKSFIDEILTTPEDRVLVKGIIEMVHALGISVVAEGIEKKEMGILLKHMHCDMAQGYYFCKPIPADEFIKLIVSNTRYQF